MKIRPVGAKCSTRTQGRTAKHDESNSSFRNFVKAPRTAAELGTTLGGC
jgi:hypothetical protein